MNENFKLRKTFSDKIKCEGRRKNIFVAWRERDEMNGEENSCAEREET